MRAILHIPSGQLVEFVKTNSTGKQLADGLYVTFRINGVARFSNLAMRSTPDLSRAKFRHALIESDNIPLLLHYLTSNLELRLLKEEFEIVEV